MPINCSALVYEWAESLDPGAALVAAMVDHRWSDWQVTDRFVRDAPLQLLRTVSAQPRVVDRFRQLRGFGRLTVAPDEPPIEVRQLALEDVGDRDVMPYSHQAQSILLGLAALAPLATRHGLLGSWIGDRLDAALERERRDCEQQHAADVRAHDRARGLLDQENEAGSPNA